MSIPRSTSPQNNHFREVITTTLCWKWFQQAAFKLQHHHISCVFSLEYICVVSLYFISQKTGSKSSSNLCLFLEVLFTSISMGTRYRSLGRIKNLRILPSIVIFKSRITQESFEMVSSPVRMWLSPIGIVFFSTWLPPSDGGHIHQDVFKIAIPI